LGHLHDRPFEAAERRREFDGVLAAVERESEQPRAGDAWRAATPLILAPTRA
jgi:hypothetical protein